MEESGVNKKPEFSKAAMQQDFEESKNERAFIGHSKLGLLHTKQLKDPLWQLQSHHAHFKQGGRGNKENQPQVSQSRSKLQAEKLGSGDITTKKRHHPDRKWMEVG